MRIAVIITGLVLALVAGQQACANERPLVWDLSRINSNSFRLRTGVEWPSVGRPGFGVDMAVMATKTGAVTSTPVSLWGSMLLSDGRSAASLHNSRLDVDLDATGEALVFSYLGKQAWIATGDVDVVSTRSATMRTQSGRRGTFRAAQSLRLDFPQWSASVGGSLASASGTAGIIKTVSLEKRLLPRVKLTARVSEAATVPTARFKVGYSARW